MTLLPSPHENEVQTSQSWTTEAFLFLQRTRSQHTGQVPEIGPLLERTNLEGVLSATELHTVLIFLEGVSSFKERLYGKVNGLTLLSGWLEELPDYEPMFALLRASFTKDGTLADEASPALSHIRFKKRNQSQRLRDKLESMLRNASIRSALSETIITFRGNRFVLPVRADHRGVVPGIVHDTSTSGLT